MLNVGFLTVQEKAREKLKTSQKSPCGPHLISEQPCLQLCTSVRSTPFMSPLLDGSPPFFQETSSPHPYESSPLRDHPFILGFSIESTAFPHPSIHSNFPVEILHKSGDGSGKGLLGLPCQCELQASWFYPFFFFLSFPQRTNINSQRQDGLNIRRGSKIFY